ncbi:hypothetical protein GCM10022243_48290 [Saccharothrix violaceirubra]|uniref:Uncharacterized protein n=1 Tax=Saccharothrix violaceirubra TaxID=413306 RepID=A0A7W7WU44_9PSEU|nr:hypothetical protein [Saccharothrix violaceirubra]MBB4963829.1 hypothetical protein [Saccharothrix violaceirubra]
MTGQPRPIGDLLDALGVTAQLGDHDRITEAVVIAKVVELDSSTGDPLLGVYTAAGTDWIAQRGLVHAAREVLEATPPVGSDDPD